MAALRLAIDANEANVAQPVGSNVYALRLIQELYRLCKKASRYQVTVLLAAPRVADLPAPRANWRYVIVTPRKFWTQWALPIHLSLHRHDYDVFFTPGHYAPRFSGVPYISSVMDLAYLHFPQQFRPLDLWQLTNWTKYSVHRAQQILTISQFSKTEIVKHYQLPAKNITVAYPASSLAKAASQDNFKAFLKQWGIRSGYLLYLGTLQPRKNLITLVKAYETYLLQLLSQGHKPAAQILKQAPQLVIAGKIGWLTDDLLNYIAQSRFVDQIILPGYVPDQFKKPLYARAKLSFLLSLYEGFGIPALESLTAGCLCLVANNSSLPEVVGDKQLTVDPQDHKAIAAKIANLTQLKKADYQKLVKARQRYIERFTWAKSAKKVLTLINKTARKRHA